MGREEAGGGRGWATRGRGGGEFGKEGRFIVRSEKILKISPSLYFFRV